MRVREEADPARPDVPEDLHPHQHRAWAKHHPAISSSCRCCSRARLKAVIELASFQAVQPELAELPRSAHGQHRRDPEHDLFQHANGRAAPGAETFQRRTRSASQRARTRKRSFSKSRTRSRAGQPELWRRKRNSSRSSPSTSPNSWPTCRTSCRTPLNSLLILSKMLAENKDENLTPEQVKFATTVYSLGQRSLGLDQRDSGSLEGGGWKDADRSQGRRAAGHSRIPRADLPPVAEQKVSRFRDPDGRRICRRKMFTDVNRLHQILKNLLSNAFKFTEKGRSALNIGLAKDRKFASGP